MSLDKTSNFNTLYDNFENQPKMFVFHGRDDILIEYQLQKKVVSKNRNSESS